MTVKDDLRSLIEAMPEAEARLWLAALRDHDPVAAAFVGAPIDDEPETPEEAAAVAKARKSAAKGKVITHEALAQELGW